MLDTVEGMSELQRIRVVIADDQELVRAGFAMVIGSQPDIQVVGQAGDGAQAVSLAESLHPDVVLMDVRMPGMDGLEATSRISALEAAINAGASGFLLKDTEPETLLSSIRTVYQGNAIIAPSATKRLIEKMMEDGYTKHGLTATDGYADGSSTMPGARPVAYTDPELNLLTEREREVLVEIAHGLSNQEIADKLFISLPTAKTHVAHILAKINARDRVQAVVFAYDNGLV